VGYVFGASLVGSFSWWGVPLLRMAFRQDRGQALVFITCSALLGVSFSHFALALEARYPLRPGEFCLFTLVPLKARGVFSLFGHAQKYLLQLN